MMDDLRWKLMKIEFNMGVLSKYCCILHGFNYTRYLQALDNA